MATLGLIYQDMSTNYIERLIVFTRYPEPGTTKTRLIPVLGAEGAADLQRKMTEHILLQVKRLSTSCELSVEIRYEGGNESLMKNWLGPDFDYQPQGSGDLGRRMQRSFEDAFRFVTDAAVIIGADIPDLSGAVIQKAFDVLKQKNVVLGPAKDGGYYLIGLQKDSSSQAIPYLFTGINWEKDGVLNKTLEVVKSLGLNFSLLDELEDLDRPEDLSIWGRLQNTNNNVFNPDRISIIIPAINEADNITNTIESIGPGDKKEVIVVDGGSNDDTVGIAKSLGARVITSAPPRARQMNRGAAQATGDVLVFLHADTRLPEKFEDFIFNSFKQPGMVAGAFQLRIDSPMQGLRLIERLVNWRSRFLKMPYCDQAIFILSRVFHQIGGFPDIPIMEDFELVRRLRKQGEIATLPVPVLTSPRRWQNLGILKTTLINQLVIATYFMGIAPEVIARWYGRSKGISERK